MVTNTTQYFVEIIASEGMELFNGQGVTNRVTAPLSADLSEWVERVVEKEEINIVSANSIRY